MNLYLYISNIENYDNFATYIIMIFLYLHYNLTDILAIFIYQLQIKTII